VPNISSSSKVARKAERKGLRNRSVRSTVKTHITKAEKLINQKGETAQEEVVATISSIDEAVSKGVIHKNKGARLKSRLMKKLNQALSEKSGA